MQTLVTDIRAAIPTIRRLDYIAEMIDGKVVKDGRDAGIDDRSEGGYIRRGDGDIDTEEKQVASCTVNIQITEPFVIVLGWSKGGIVSYMDKVLSILAANPSVTVERMELNKTRIIEQETGEEKQTNDSYQLGKIEFTMFREISSGDCQTIEYMKCDCTKTKDLGCFTGCDPIETDLEPTPGTYKILIDFNGRQKQQEQIVTTGDKITIQYEWLNENYTHTIKIFNADGTVWKDSEENDCFTLTTKPS